MGCVCIFFKYRICNWHLFFKLWIKNQLNGQSGLINIAECRKILYFVPNELFVKEERQQEMEKWKVSSSKWQIMLTFRKQILTFPWSPALSFMQPILPKAFTLPHRHFVFGCWLWFADSRLNYWTCTNHILQWAGTMKKATNAQNKNANSNKPGREEINADKSNFEVKVCFDVRWPLWCTSYSAIILSRHVYIYMCIGTRVSPGNYVMVCIWI